MCISARPAHPQHRVLHSCGIRLQKNLEGAKSLRKVCFQDMKPQDQLSQNGATGFLSLGVDEDEEELQEAKPVETLLIGEGGEEEKGTQPKPGQEETSMEGKEVGAEEEDDGPGAPGLMGNENNEASSGGEPGEQQQEGHLQANGQSLKLLDKQRVARGMTLTQTQVQELEHIFQSNAYPNLVMRQDIARRINVPEAKVQTWFKNKRRRQRALMLRNMHSVVFSHPMGINLDGHQNANHNPPTAWMWFLQQSWIWYPQLLLLQGVLPLPLRPFPSLFFSLPPPLFLIPLPPLGPHPHGLTCFFFVNCSFIIFIF